MLKFYDSTLDYVAEQGEFQVMIGGNSKEVKTASFTLNNPNRKESVMGSFG